jgi:hypothetical protein
MRHQHLSPGMLIVENNSFGSGALPRVEDEAGSFDQWGLSEPLITLIDLIALM